MFGYIDLVVFISVLGAAAMLLPTALNWNHMAFTAQVAQIEAQQLATITDAALQYEYANSATLDSPNSSHTVTIANLIAQGYLPAGTKATDTYGNPITVQFNADGSGNVTGYVVDQGQKVYSNLEAGRLMLDLGDRGGFMPATLAGGQQPNVIYGSGGTWQLGAPAGINPGSIEVKVEPNAAQEADDSRFLWRVQAPNASENTMSTPLIMGATEPEGTGCSYTGAIAQDGTGALVSCQGGQWTAVGGGHWKTPVSTYSALPGSGNQVGDVRLTEDTDRAFAWNGGSWAALAVNQNGNLHVPGYGAFGGEGQFGGNIGTSGYSPSAGLPPGWGGGVQTWDVVAHGTIGVGPNNSSPNVSMNSAGTIENQGVCIDNNSGSCQSWGLNAHYTNGWDMVASDGGSLNANPRSALGSLDVNDIVVRSGGAYPWYSQLSNQVYTNTQTIAQQGNEISSLQSSVANNSSRISNNSGAINSINSNLNNSNVCASSPYAAFQTICSEIRNSGGSYVGAFGPATQTTTSTYSCGWRGPWWNRYWGCGWTYSSGPASASGTANGGGMTVDGQGSGPTLPYKALLISVTGLVGSQNGGGQGANWGGLSTPCGGNGVGASILAYVGPTQVADISLTKTGQPDYQTWVVTENTATFVVPAGQSFSIRANSNCAQFRGVVWAL